MKWSTYASEHYGMWSILPTLTAKKVRGYFAIEFGWWRWTYEIEFFTEGAT